MEIGRETSLHGRNASVIVLLVALAALWPAMVNGGPFYHPDTPSYLRGAASAAYKALGLKTAWSGEYLRVYDASAAMPSAAAAAPAEIPVTLNGRSIYYGAFLYLSYLAGSMWFAVVVQALLAAASIYLTVILIGRAMGAQLRASHIAMIGAIAVLATPLGYVSAHLLPDIFAGIGLLALANLLFLWSWQSRPERIFWIAMLAYAQLVHSTNMLLATALLIGAIPYDLLRKTRVNLAPLAAVAGCIAAGALGQFLFVQAVKEGTGAPPVRPPFLAMRVIADGPGHAYLREHCPTEKSFYCNVVRQQHPQSDELLWSPDRQISLFRGRTPAEQRISAAEQGRFVRSVIAERPGEVIAAAARNSWDQLLKADLTMFNYSQGNRDRFDRTIPSQLLAPMKHTPAYNERMPTRAVEIGTALVSIGAVLFLILFLARRRDRPIEPMKAYCLCILAAVAINAVICGALSGPKGRYETRLLWVLPIVAGAAGFSAERSRSGRQAVT
jgi:hypothetical protein